jgi:hypothetical protein
MTINSAQAELLALAEAMRGPDWADDLAGALLAAGNSNWPLKQAYGEAFRLLLDENGHPREMRDACRNPLKPGRAGADPGVVASAMAEMRSVLTQDGDAAA